MDVNPGYKNIEKIRIGIIWFMTERKDSTSTINFRLLNENENIVFLTANLLLLLSIT